MSAEEIGVKTASGPRQTVLQVVKEHHTFGVLLAVFFKKKIVASPLFLQPHTQK